MYNNTNKEGARILKNEFKNGLINNLVRANRQQYVHFKKDVKKYIQETKLTPLQNKSSSRLALNFFELIPATIFEEWTIPKEYVFTPEIMSEPSSSSSVFDKQEILNLLRKRKLAHEKLQECVNSLESIDKEIEALCTSTGFPSNAKSPCFSIESDSEEDDKKEKEMISKLF